MTKAITNSFSYLNRNSEIEKLKNEVFDLLIVGGGINGAGIARDAASRGLKVALIEARDFAVGTSSRSSKLIHGGIRYLENFEFGLVFEALSERSILFEIAPHMVHPLRFVIPLFKNSKVGMFKMGLGMWAYDLLALLDTPEMHQRLSHDYFSNQYPFIRSGDLMGGYSYSDAYMDDDRLVIETMRSARNFGAVAESYVKSVSKIKKHDDYFSIETQDQISNEKFDIQFKHLVSTVGPWTDDLGAELFSNWKKVLRPTKGIHLTFSRERVPLKEAFVMGAEDRIVFAIPRHEMVIIGTTDTDFHGNPADVKVLPEDVEYVLKVANNYFPGLELKDADIVASYAGVRPLVYDGSATEGKTSREHQIWTVNENVTFVAGGKYTTYRLIAEQAVDHILDKRGLTNSFSNSKTHSPINPKVTIDKIMRIKGDINEIAERANISPEFVELGIERHGEEVLDFIFYKSSREFKSSEEKYWYLEAVHAIKTTNCFHLVDFYWRRSPLFLSRHDHGLGLLESVAAAFEDILGWSSHLLQNEITKLNQQIKSELSWKK